MNRRGALTRTCDIDRGESIKLRYLSPTDTANSEPLDLHHFDHLSTLLLAAIHLPPSSSSQLVDTRALRSRFDLVAGVRAS